MLNLLYKLSRNNGIMGKLTEQLFSPNMGLLIELISHSCVTMNIYYLGS